MNNITNTENFIIIISAIFIYIITTVNRLKLPLLIEQSKRFFVRFSINNSFRSF